MNIIEKENFVDYLLGITGCEKIEDLANLFHVSRATLNNWTMNRISKLSPSTRKKIKDVMDNHPEWGIQLGAIKNSTIEIITTGRDAKDSFNKTDQSSQEDSNLIKRVLKENYDLKDEIIMLKEKIQKYEVKK